MCIYFFFEIYIRVIAPGLVIVVPALFVLLHGTLITEWDSSHGIIGNPAFYRGLYEMSAGVILYYFSKKNFLFIEKLNANYQIRLLLQVAEVILMIFIVSGSLMNVSTIIIVIAIWVMVFLGWNIEHNALLSNKLYDKLYSITLSMYINHALFVDTRLFLRNQFPLLRFPL